MDVLFADAQMTDVQKCKIYKKKTTVVVAETRSSTLILALHNPLDEGTRDKLVSVV